jgi:hypothetical protein
VGKKAYRLSTRTFRQKKVVVTRGWREFHNGELHNLVSSPTVIMVIKSRRIRWEKHAACIEEIRHAQPTNFMEHTPSRS